MLVRVPDYYDGFQCLAGDCPHSCCEKWTVVLDGDTVCRYRQEPGALGEKLRRAMVTDEEGDVCFPLNGGRCPFLDGENLCEIHRQLGEEATSVTCREHPRFTEDYGAFREITLSASCPAANALLLGSDEPLTFVERETAEPEESADPWLKELLPLRNRMLAGLEDRSYPMILRMGVFLRWAEEAQACLDREEPEVLESVRPEGEIRVPRLPEGGLAFLAGLECLEPDWRDTLARAEAMSGGAVPEPLLERICVYFAFRYLLKTVNDGDLLSRAQLCVFAALAVERLAGVLGVGEALRRFSCEVEHSDENLEALLEAFWQGELCVLP